MENKKVGEAQVQLSNLALKHLVEELQFLQNGFVNKVQSLEGQGIKIKVHTKQFGDKSLLVLPNALFVAEQSLPAKQNPGGFSAFLNKHLYNQRIIELKQRGLDRIIVLEFPEVFLILELFAKGNLILCNKEWIILRAMKKEEWSDRKLEQAQKYKFPSSKGTNPLEENQSDFAKKLLENKKTSFGACVDLLNINPAVLEKVFSDLGLDKKQNSSELNIEHAKKILENIKKIYSSKSSGAYLSENVIYSVETGKEKEQVFSSINSGLNKLFLSSRAPIDSEKLTKENKIKSFNFSEKGVVAKLSQIDLLEKQEKEAKEKGEALFLNYAELSVLIKEIKELQKKGLGEKQILEKVPQKRIKLKNLSLQKESCMLES